MEKTDKDDIYFLLNKIGLEEEEIFDVKSRNKLLNTAVSEDIEEILGYLHSDCLLSFKDVRYMIINNPLILNESVDRVKILKEVYDYIGFSKEEYKEFLQGFDKAFSLNPKELIERIEGLKKEGKNKQEIKSIMIKRPYEIF